MSLGYIKARESEREVEFHCDHCGESFTAIYGYQRFTMRRLRGTEDYFTINCVVCRKICRTDLPEGFSEIKSRIPTKVMSAKGQKIKIFAGRPENVPSDLKDVLEREKQLREQREQQAAEQEE